MGFCSAVPHKPPLFVSPLQIPSRGPPAVGQRPYGAPMGPPYMGYGAVGGVSGGPIMGCRIAVLALKCCRRGAFVVCAYGVHLGSADPFGVCVGFGGPFGVCVGFGDPFGICMGFAVCVYGVQMGFGVRC